MNIKKAVRLSNYHVYWQYVIMYLLLIIIVILVLTPIYSQVLSIAKRVYLQEVNYNLISSADNFEKRIEATWQIQNSMNQSEYYKKVKLFRDSKLPSDYYVYMDLARKFFTNQCSMIGLEEESFIVFKNSGVAITRSSTYESVKNCFLEQIIYDRFSENEIIDKIYNMNYIKTFIPISEVYLSSNHTYGRYLTLLTGLPNESTVVGTLFSEDKLYELFNIPNLPDNTFFYIKDASNNILLSKNLGQIPVEVSENTSHITYDSVSYNVIQHTMESIGYKVIIGIPDYYFNEVLAPLKALNIRYVLIAIGIGILFSVIFTLYNYMPLKKLIDKPLITERSRKKLQVHEYNCIREIIEESDCEIQILRNNIRDMDKNLRVNLFIRLLHGNVIADDEMNLVMQLIPQLLLDYRIAIIKISVNNNDLSNINYFSFLVYDQLSRLLSPDFLFGQLDRTKMAVLIPGTQHNAQLFTEIIGQINSNLSIDNIALTAGISEICTGIDKINTAFYHAQFSLLDKNEDSISYYTAVSEIEPFSIDLFELQRLNELVQAGKCKDIEEMLEEVSFVLMNGESYSWEDVRETFYIVRFVLRLVIKNMQCKSVVLPEYNMNETIQELFTALGNTAKKIAEELDERKQNAKLELRKDIINYINNNFSNKLINAAFIADNLGISESYAYKLVKEFTGYSLNDYIRKLRIEKAVDMLNETDSSVSSISNDCGFDVIRTFYREFRKQYGVTPSQFRQNSIDLSKENTT